MVCDLRFRDWNLEAGILNKNISYKYDIIIVCDWWVVACSE
jgi:hypothetical protein